MRIRSVWAMAKPLTILTCITFLVCTLYGCQTVTCISSNLTFELIGFSEAEADTLIVRRYIKGDGFTVLKDASLSSVNYIKKNDTLIVSFVKGGYYFDSRSDYQVYLPGAGKQYSITEINEEVVERKYIFFVAAKPSSCNTKSLKINGQIVALKNNIFYPKK